MGQRLASGQTYLSPHSRFCARPTSRPVRQSCQTRRACRPRTAQPGSLGNTGSRSFQARSSPARALESASSLQSPYRTLSETHHAQQPCSVVLDLKVLVRELGAIDARGARSVSVQKVPSLAHEPRNDAVHDAVLVPQWLTVPPARKGRTSAKGHLGSSGTTSLPVLSGAELAEVLRGSATQVS